MMGITTTGINDIALEVTTRGIKEYQRWQRRKRRELRKGMRRQMREVGKIVRKEAKAQARSQGLISGTGRTPARMRKRPWNTKPMGPGTLVRSISYKVFYVGGDLAFEGGNEFGVVIRSGKQGFYGRFHELGWTHRGGKRVAARPFLAPALSAREHQVEETIGRSLNTYERP